MWITQGSSASSTSSRQSDDRPHQHNARILNGTLSLHDIRDVEAFCANIIRRRNRPINEDALAYLIDETWILSTNYDPSRGSRFSAWAKLTLDRRLTDHDRQHHGDHRYHNGRLRGAAQHLPLDHPLVNALPASPLDDPAHSDRTLLRQLRDRDRTQDRPYPIMGTRSTRRVA